MKNTNLHKALDLLIQDFQILEGDREVDNQDVYTPSKALITSFIYGRERSALSCTNIQADVRSRIKYILKGFDGSEISNNKLESATDMLEKLITQGEIIQQQIDESKQYFLHKFGHEYRTPTKARDEGAVLAKNKQTAAYKKAQELVGTEQQYPLNHQAWLIANYAWWFYMNQEPGRHIYESFSYQCLV